MVLIPDGSDLYTTDDEDDHDMNDRVYHDAICNTMESLVVSGSFATSGALFPAELVDPEIEVHGVGPIQFPLCAADIDSLCQSSREGVESPTNSTRADAHSSQVWTIDACHLKFGSGWSSIVGEALKKVKIDFGWEQDASIAVHPHKLYVHEPGIHTEQYRASEQDMSHIATMALTLPSEHIGGNITFSQNNETRTLDTAHISNSEYQYLAWYTNADYVIEPILSGVRLVLTYCLAFEDTIRPGLQLKDSDVQVAGLCESLASWAFASENLTKPYMLIYELEHALSTDTSKSGNFTGTDLVRLSVLESVAAPLGIGLFTGLVKRRVSHRVPDDEEITPHRSDYIQDDQWTLSEIRPFEDCLPLGKAPVLKTSMVADKEYVSIDKDDFVQSNLCHSTPEENRQDGSFWNDAWFYKLALILVPSRNHTMFQLRLWNAGHSGSTTRKNLTTYITDRMSFLKEHQSSYVGPDENRNLRRCNSHTAFDDVRHMCQAVIAGHRILQRTVNPTLEGLFDTVAAAALELGEYSLFRKAAFHGRIDRCQRFLQYGEPCKVIIALVQKLCASPDLHVWSSLNWWISLQGDSSNKFVACDQIITHYKSRCSSTADDSHNQINRQEINDDALRDWKKARMYDALAQDHIDNEEPDHVDYVLSILLSIKFQDPSFLHRTPECEQTCHEDPETILTALSLLTRYRDLIGETLMDEKCTVLTGYLLDDFIITSLNVVSEAARIARVGKVLGETWCASILHGLRYGNMLRGATTALLREGYKYDWWTRPELYNLFCTWFLDPTIASIQTRDDAPWTTKARGRATAYRQIQELILTLKACGMQAKVNYTVGVLACCTLLDYTRLKDVLTLEEYQRLVETRAKRQLETKMLSE